MQKNKGRFYNRPRRDYEYIAAKVDAFLSKHWPGGYPVNIERIIELTFGMKIVPIQDIIEDFERMSWLSRDLSTIFIDASLANDPPEYRLTMAHELAHRVFHPEFYSTDTFVNIDQWLDWIQNEVPQAELAQIEWEAECFAGLLLVPSNTLQDLIDFRTAGISNATFDDTMIDALATLFVVPRIVMRDRLLYEGVEIS
jgi:Zn-dependent peptidase ImmA (M78 family)